MTGIEETVWCDGCGVELTWAPVVVGKHRYCCLDCQAGIPCRCGERLEIDEDRREKPASSPQPPGGYLF